MRIAHIEAGRHLYGGAAQVRYLLGGLADSGAESFLLCPPGGELGAAVPAATRVVELPMRGELDVALLPRLVRALKALRPDLVHVHSRRGADLYGGMAALLAGVPCVITRRVDTVEPVLLARLKYRPYRRVIALSRAIDRQLRDVGVPAERLTLIPSGVDTQRYRPDSSARARLRAAFGLPADALVVGVMAQLIERKRHSWLFAQLPQLVARAAAGLRRVLRPWAARAAVARRACRAGFGGPCRARGLSRRRAAVAARSRRARASGGARGAGAGAGRGRQRRSGRRRVRGRRCARCRRRRRDWRARRPRRHCGFLYCARGLARFACRAATLGAAARRHAERRFDTARLVNEHLSLYTRLLGERAGAPARTALR